MTERFEQVDAILQDIKDERFKYLRDEMSDAEQDAACEHNMTLFRAWASAQSLLLAELEDLNPDRGVGAIWRRAYQRSLDTSTDPDRAIRSRRWKARALGLNPEPTHNAIALGGMAPLQWEERWMLAVAIPQPAPSGDLGYDIEDVVLIDPETGKAMVMGDVGATHVSPPHHHHNERLSVLTDAKAWARQIALDRLEWWQLRDQRRRLLQVEPLWFGWPSAALLLSDPKKMRWSELSASVLEVPVDMREAVRRAVLAEARLPRIEGRA